MNQTINFNKVQIIIFSKLIIIQKLALFLMNQQKSTANFYRGIIFLYLTFSFVKSISIIYQKKNLIVPQNQFYNFNVQIQKSNAELIPSYVNIDYQIINSLPTAGGYFDFFYYMSNSDIDCYVNAKGNQSYLFPCPFLTNNYAYLRTNHVNKLQQIKNLPITQIQNLNFTFIVDNTKFPFPNGAFPFELLNIQLKSFLNISISSSYEDLGIKLIYINVTVFLIYMFVILCLIWKQKKIKRLMEGEANSSYKQNLLKQAQKDDSDQGSAQQNYTQFIRDPFTPSSLLTSSNKQNSMQLHREQQ